MRHLKLLIALKLAGREYKMTDTFEKTLLAAIDNLTAKISAAEERMMSDQCLIDVCTSQKETFEALLRAYLEKKKEGAEAFATLLYSGKTPADFKTYSELTGTEFPDGFVIGGKDAAADD